MRRALFYAHIGFTQQSNKLEFVGCGAAAPLPPPLGEVAAPRGLTERVSLGRSITFGSPPQSKIKDFCQLPQGGAKGMRCAAFPSGAMSST